MMTSVATGISIINHAVLWGNLLFSTWWRGGFKLVLDLIKIIKTIKPHCEISVH